MSRIAITLAGAVVLAVSAPVHASWFVQGVPAATCSTDSRTTATWSIAGSAS